MILFFCIQLVTIRVLNIKLNEMVDKFWRARDMEAKHLNLVEEKSFKAGYHQALTDFSRKYYVVPPQKGKKENSNKKGLVL